MNIPSTMVGLLGGTFNPVHFGHLRLAAATADALGLQRLELLPCAVPPHKQTGLLPFEMRVSLLQAALEDSPDSPLTVNTLEGQLESPSYTWNLLHAWQEQHPEESPLFIMGAEDFAHIDTWHRGIELPTRTHIAVIPRGQAHEAVFRATVARLWPHATITEAATRQQEHAEASCGLLSAQLTPTTQCLFLPLPFLDISASAIRTLWLQGKSIHYLTPEPVVSLLDRYAQDVKRFWL